MKIKNKLKFTLFLVVPILIISLLFILKTVNRQDVIEVGVNTKNNNEEQNELDKNDTIMVYPGQNEINNLLDSDKIVVVLPNDKNNNNEENDIKDIPNTNNVSNKKYYIKVNNQANVVTIYKKDSNGQYTVPVKAMLCSTGSDTPTSGTYDIKLRWEWLDLFGDVYGHYSTQIVGNILFHSVPYLEKWNPASLEYWEYDKLGTSCSAGCIRLTVAEAKWNYDNIEQGTLVEFYYSSDPGPLRKTNCTKNIR